MSARYIALYLDHPKTGCGWRSYLVLKEGRKWARLICTETAEPITLPLKALGGSRPLELKRSRLARRLRGVARDYGLDKTTPVRDALRLLKGAA